MLAESALECEDADGDLVRLGHCIVEERRRDWIQSSRRPIRSYRYRDEAGRHTEIWNPTVFTLPTLPSTYYPPHLLCSRLTSVGLRAVRNFKSILPHEHGPKFNLFGSLRIKSFATRADPRELPAAGFDDLNIRYLRICNAQNACTPTSLEAFAEPGMLRLQL
jgi:hypothetical protein